ncbi:MAG TPA: helix-turn-helix domain-containing protein [Allosphingosinicella sp.]|nr:helix-turn-helix domain-containing protein [Allosphingosinicella sp.]
MRGMSIGMAGQSVDMERVRDVLRATVKPAGPHSQRGLARKAGLDRDAVYDIVQGRNRNPSLKLLAALAEAMDSDLSIFGVELHAALPSAAALEQAILESLPAMPRRGSWQRKASFLAESVARILELPPAPRATPPAPARPRRRGPAKAAPPPAATS